MKKQPVSWHFVILIYHADMVPRRDITPVNIPTHWEGSLAVERLEGTRWYVESGPIHTFRQWLDEIHKSMRRKSGGILLPLQWVPAFVGVSRESVLKRAKNGGLTVFSFKVTERSRSILGGVRDRETKQKYDLVPYVECQEWRDILLDVADSIGNERLGN